ncbi:MAG: hypothetical protein NVS9B13_20870 [Candidatus Acidiferrum sp.]
MSRSQVGVGAAYINMEMGALRRILRQVKRWHVIGEELRPLRERPNVGRALSREEKAKLITTAASRPEWQGASCAMLIALNTTMRWCELKGLRWRNVDLLNQSLTIERSKTDAGERVIPMNVEALAAILELYKRSQSFDGTHPDHFVFPACENGRVNPSRSQETWRTAWRRITKAADLPGFRFHDLRRHAITELAESPASEQTIMAIAGHFSHKMLAHYSHVRMQAKSKALAAISTKFLEGGYDTKNVTIGTPQPTPDSQVIEIDGRPVGTRTPDLHRVKVAL